ncbi:MAG: hypothetical protein Kow0069_08190 [Promethearchaeota archaeon]
MPSTWKKIKDSFVSLKDKARTSVSIQKQSVIGLLALSVVVVLAVLIRMSPVFRGPEIIKAFDPWVQYDSTRYLIENGLHDYLNWHDSTMWFPEGKDRWFLRPGLPMTTAAFYYLLKFVGITPDIYLLCYYFPAVMGGLTVVAIYFLGKELADHRTGLLAAFFLAFNPGHMQRTMVGFYDNETVGVFASVMVFLFFLKAIRTGNPVHATLGGLFFGYLAASWGAITYMALLLPLISLVLILAQKFSPRLLVAFAGTVGVGLLITTVSTNFVSFGVFLKDMDYVVPLAFLGVMLGYYFIDRQKVEHPRFYEGFWRFIKWSIVPAIVAGAIILWQFPQVVPFDLHARFESILNPATREDAHIVASVGEHMPSPWSVFYFNTLIPMFLVPVGFYFAFRRFQEQDLVVIIYVLTLFYFTGSMIRIVLLFAPAASLVGAYGLSMVLKHFGGLMRKEKIVRSRRRKRQIKRTMGTPEGAVVFALVGVLLVAQVNHAASVSIEQMSWSELIAGGSFHDWEEALTWMRENLPGTAVVVSWWDYGYWMNIIGNVTTVNDNGTDNSSRIGLTGMAFMQTDEIESAKILRLLHADYVLVYFGHLLNGLGGDEGKWPWMLRIANDHTNLYLKWGLEAYNWETQNGKNYMFDESKYINGSSGKYEDLWFQCQLVRLMFADEPTELSDANTNLDYFFARELNGDESKGVKARVDDDGNTWKSHIPPGGKYDFKVFKKAFYSTNHLVKIFKVDYTALDSSIRVRNASVRADGFGSVVVENVGKKEVDIKNVTVTGRDVSKATDFTFPTTGTHNITTAVEGGSGALGPGQSKTVWFHLNSTQVDLEEGDEARVTVRVEAPSLEGEKYEFENSSLDLLVTPAVEPSIEILHWESTLYTEPSVRYELAVKNTGNVTVKLKGVKVQDFDFQFYSDYNNKVLTPGNVTRLRVYPTLQPIPLELQTVAVYTEDGAYDVAGFANNTRGYKISMLPADRRILPEYEALGPLQYRREVVPVDPANFAAFVNGTVRATVQNTGDDEVGLQSLFVNGTNVPFVVEAGSLFLQPGERATIRGDAGTTFDVNDQLTVFVTATGPTGKRVASDGCLTTAVVDGPSLTVLPRTGGTKFDTYALANETVLYTVKNTGTEPLTITGFTINGTAEVGADSGSFQYGDASLGVQEVAVFRANFDGVVKLNQSTLARLAVKAGAVSSPAVETDAQLLSFVGVHQDVELFAVTTTVKLTNATASDDVVNLALAFLSEVGTTFDAIYLNDTYIPLAQWTYVNGSPVDTWDYPPSGDLRWFVIKTDVSGWLDLVADEKLEVRVVTTQGDEAVDTLTVV